MSDAPPSTLPRGRASLPRDVVADSQRRRLLAGMVEAVAARGYAAVTVADVISRAGVSRTTFYENFRDKEECFLAAYERGARAHYDRVVAASRTEDGWLARLRAGVHAWLEGLEREPEYARTFLLEVMAAGPRALEARAAIHQLYMELLKSWHAQARVEESGLPELPDEVFAASVAAGNELLVSRLGTHGTGDLLALAPKILYIDLALFGAAELAKSTLEAAPTRE